VRGPAQEISQQGDSAYAYLTYMNSGAVGGIDWGRGKTLWRRTVGERVDHVQFDYYHGRRLWVTDRRTGSVLAMSSRDGRVLRRLRAIWNQRTWHRRLVRVGDGPHGVAEIVLP